ncbi:MAG: hypothetical protein ACK4NF_00440 [Planctomycetota bacterium]
MKQKIQFTPYILIVYQRKRYMPNISKFKVDKKIEKLRQEKGISKTDFRNLAMNTVVNIKASNTPYPT